MDYHYDPSRPEMLPPLVDLTALANLQQLARRITVETSGMIEHTGDISVTGVTGTSSPRADVRTFVPTSGFHAKTQP